MTLRVGNKAPLRTFPPPPKPHPSGKGRRELLLEKAIAVKEEERREAEAERAAREQAAADALAEKRAARKAAIDRAVAPVVAFVKALDPRPYAKAAATAIRAALNATGTALRSAYLASKRQTQKTGIVIGIAIARSCVAGANAVVGTIKRLDPRPLLARIGRRIAAGTRTVIAFVSAVITATGTRLISLYRSFIGALVRVVVGVTFGITRSIASAALRTVSAIKVGGLWLAALARSGLATAKATMRAIWRGFVTVLKSVGEISLAIWSLLRRADLRPLIRAAQHLSRDLVTWLISLATRAYAALARGFAVVVNTAREVVTLRRVAGMGYAAVVIGAVVLVGPRMLDSVSEWQQRSPVVVAEVPAEPEKQVAIYTERESITVPVPEPALEPTITAFEEHLEAPVEAATSPAISPAKSPATSPDVRYASVTPIPRPEAQPTSPDEGLVWPPVIKQPDGEARPRIAIVIDDMGMVQGILSDMLALEGPITYAFLPYSPNLKDQTRRTLEAGHQLMVHLPMEPKRRTANPGPMALLTTLSSQNLAERLNWNLDQFDGYVGVNNHMGSLFTENSEGMQAVIAELKSRNLFFLDSVTTSNTVGYGLAGEIGVPRAQRDIFLDNKRSYSAVMKQLKKVEKKALRDGQVIAIGHPYRVTHQALRDWLPTLQARGFELVAVSRLIRPPDSENNIATSAVKVAGQLPAPADIAPASGSGSFQ